MSRKNWTDEKLFFRLLNNKTDRTRFENIRALRSRANKYVFERSHLLAQSGIAKEQLIGIEILSQLGAPPRPFLKPTLKLFFGLLRTENKPRVLSTVLYGLGHNNKSISDRETKLLCTFKNHKYAEVREGLTFALGGKDSEVAIETLIELSKDRIDWIRDWATFGIGSQTEIDNEKVRKTLWERVNDKYISAREEAIFGLAKRKDPGIKPILVEALIKIDHHGSYMLEAIEAFQDMDFIPLIKKKIKENKSENTINEDWLKKSLKVLEELQFGINT
jgi:hypothetical protein